MKMMLLAVGIPVCAIVALSIMRFAREKTVGRLLRLLGASCLLVVVFAHIAEGFHLFSGMNWGQNNSPGHYLDFVRAVLGLTLLPLGFLINAPTRRRHPPRLVNPHWSEFGRICGCVRSG